MPWLGYMDTRHLAAIQPRRQTSGIAERAVRRVKVHLRNGDLLVAHWYDIENCQSITDVHINGFKSKEVLVIQGIKIASMSWCGRFLGTIGNVCPSSLCPWYSSTPLTIVRTSTVLLVSQVMGGTNSFSSAPTVCWFQMGEALSKTRLNCETETQVRRLTGGVRPSGSRV